MHGPAYVPLHDRAGRTGLYRVASAQFVTHWTFDLFSSTDDKSLSFKRESGRKTLGVRLVLVLYWSRRLGSMGYPVKGKTVTSIGARDSIST